MAQKFTVISDVEIDGQQYTADTEIELEDEVVAGLSDETRAKLEAVEEDEEDSDTDEDEDQDDSDGEDGE